MKKNVRVVYYAVLKQERGLPEEKIDSLAHTVGDLFAELKERHQLRMCESQVQVAINSQMVSWKAPLKNGDSILFIPIVIQESGLELRESVRGSTIDKASRIFNTAPLSMVEPRNFDAVQTDS